MLKFITFAKLTEKGQLMTPEKAPAVLAKVQEIVRTYGGKVEYMWATIGLPGRDLHRSARREEGSGHGLVPSEPESRGMTSPTTPARHSSGTQNFKGFRP